jgi:hypothetical protein
VLSTGPSGPTDWGHVGLPLCVRIGRSRAVQGVVPGGAPGTWHNPSGWSVSGSATIASRALPRSVRTGLTPRST